MTRLGFALALVCWLATGSFADSGPSFDCSGQLSKAERLICQDAELAALDRQLSGYYRTARERAERTMIGDKPAIEWFEANAREEWQWREQNCADRTCIASWYWRRTALLKWLASSDDGFGVDGIVGVKQIAGRDTIVSYHMVTHIRNVLYDVSTGEHEMMADGYVRVISEAPLTYELSWQKSYFLEGGAFWFTTLRDADHRMLSISPAEPGNEICMDKAVFTERATLIPGALALIPAGPVCVSR